MKQNSARSRLALPACLLASVLLLSGCGAPGGAGRPAEGAASGAFVEDAASEAPQPPALIDLARPEGGALDLGYLTGQQNGATPPARPGDTLTEQELIGIAKDLLVRSAAFYDWVRFPGCWKVDPAAPLVEEQNGEPRPLYPLLDFADEAQLRAVYTSIYSEDALRREEERVRARVKDGQPLRFQTRQGRLYADLMADAGRNVSARDPDTLRLVGASADAAVLEAANIFPDGEPMGWSESVTLLRENGRWVLAGTLWDMPLDNRFVPLPAELDSLAQTLDAEDPDTAFNLRQAARLGQALMAGDAAAVNRCFIDRGGKPPLYDVGDYAFADLSGLKISGWQAEWERPAPALSEPAGEQAGPVLPPAPRIWLRLTVDDPGATPLRQGSERYLLSFHGGGDSSFARGCIASLRPESEVAGVDEALLDEATRQTRLLRWFLGRDAFDGLAGEEPLRLLCYLTVRLRWEGLTDENGGFTPQQLADAPERWLGMPVSFSEELLLGDGYTFANGRWYPPGRDGYGGSGPEGEYRFIVLGRQGDAVSATLRFYRDAQCLVPDYDLRYTFRLSEAGDWQPLRCERVEHPQG